MSNLISELHKHGLRNTPFRQELLKMFYEVNSSLTTEEIKGRLLNSRDRVTIYRALEAFEKCGLIHQVPDKGNLTRYALCYTACSSDHHVHNHAHFICEDCSETFCVDEIIVPKIKSTKGFKVKKSKLTLEGVCSNCSES